MMLWLLSWMALGLAEDEPVAFDEEMIVEERADPEETRKQVEVVLEAWGYRPGRRKKDRVIYRSTNPRYPTLILTDEGLLLIDRPAGRRAVRSVTGTTRYRRNWETPLLVALDPLIDAWRESLIQERMDARYQEIPDVLEAVWTQGAPLYGVESGETPRARRAAILAFWASRTDTPEGRRVQQITADFLFAVVQPSPWPVTLQEQARAEETCRCGPLFQN